MVVQKRRFCCAASECRVAYLAEDKGAVGVGLLGRRGSNQGGDGGLQCKLGGGGRGGRHATDLFQCAGHGPEQSA